MRPHELPLIAGDPAVFEAFYRDNVEAVQGFVARRIADPHLAADLTAEVFLAAIDAAPTYRSGRGAPGAWLFGIARNVVNAEYRRAGREQRANARVVGHRLLDPDDITRMQERIDAAARSRELYSALDDLTPRQAAAVLGIHPVTARVRLHRARVALRRQLFQEDPQPLTQSMEA
jgi:RNA polymerase sigma-70 factor (ECF subfamily)